MEAPQQDVRTCYRLINRNKKVNNSVLNTLQVDDKCYSDQSAGRVEGTTLATPQDDRSTPECLHT